MMTRIERERVIAGLSDDELLIWHAQDGTRGLSRSQAERVRWLMTEVGKNERAPARRLSPWEWFRLNETWPRDLSGEETEEELAAVERALRAG